jgi:putative peptidyl-prolyl cis-trans isomerase
MATTKALIRVPAFLLAALLLWTAPGSAQKVNEIWAIVNEQPITKADVLYFQKRAPKMKGILPQNLKNKKAVLDYLIDRKIIEYKAEQESLSVPLDKLEKRIQRVMKSNGLKSKKALDKKLKERGSSLKMYRQIFKQQLYLQQLIQLNIIQARRPRRQEIKEWYKKHPKEVGVEINLRMVSVPYNPNSIKSERKANQQISRIRRRIKSGKLSFAAAARKHRGLLGWQHVAQLAQRDRMLANMAYRLRKRRGRVSQVFKGHGSNRYYIIQVRGTRKVPYDKVKQGIFRMLAMKKREQAVEQWLKAQRQRMSVKIYMPGHPESIKISQN